MILMCLILMVSMLGMAIDLGRMFIYKNELQAFVDSSAMAAITRMDGTQAGLTAANALAAAGPLSATVPNKYNFDSATISTVTNTYATAFNNTYDSYATADSPATNSYRFVQVVASASVPLNFLPVIPGISTSMTLSATAVAGQNPQSSVSDGGLLPFAPDAHNQADKKNFGLIPGSSYTLKWGNGNNTTCAGDLLPSPFMPLGSPPSEHGFIDIGEGNSNSNVRTAIEYGGYPNASSSPSSIGTGDLLDGVPGNRGTSIFDALNGRAQQDTDDVSTTYAQYLAAGTGNGRRIVTVAVAGTWNGNGNGAATPNLGFANFLLNTSYAGTSGPICAIYIGPGDLSGNGTGGTDGTKVYSVMLYK
ncbi:MAG TPA: Tad domain-containing protein [Bryobacteraceae bacterium]